MSKSGVDLPEPTRNGLVAAALWLSLVLPEPAVQQEAVFETLRWLIDVLRSPAEAWPVVVARPAAQLALLRELMPDAASDLEIILAQAQAMAAALDEGDTIVT